MVLLGDNKACPVSGIGSVVIKMHDNIQRTLTDVRYVPELKRNLISIGALTNKGCIVKIDDSTLKVVKGSLVVMKGEYKNGLYYLLGETVTGIVSTVVSQKSSDMTRLWHLRFGHVSDRGLIELEKQGILKGKLSGHLGFCEQCVYGKSCKVKFRTGIHTTSEPLAYVHSDLWGASRVKTLGGASYFMSIIDDYSRKVWVFLLKSKDQAFITFVNWKKLVENQTRRKVRKLRTDNGLEYCSKEFDDFCTREGIARHRTVARTPQQNGLAERMNRTLLERVRCMLNGAGLERHFWGEAIKTACYLINRCPSPAINFITPQEKWTQKAPDCNHLKVFGCSAYAHIRQDKLQPRALKCIFLGYPEGVKGYKLWCLEPRYKKCIISRDVTFNEADMPLKKDTTQKPNSEIRNESIEIEVEKEKIDNHSSITEQHESETEIESTQSELNNYQLARDRQRREIHPPNKFGYADIVDFTAFALCTASEIENSEPASYAEAINSKDRRKWIQAINEEMDSLIKNKTWTLVHKPEGQRLIGCKWIFKRKDDTNGSNIRFKARLVAKGFTQKEGVDYNDIFSPVVKQTSIRAIMSLAAKHDLEIQQMDVRTTFLHGNLEEEIYMRQPEGFESKDPNLVCLLNKSLYGLKQAPRQWNIRFDEFMTKINFNKSKYDPRIYTNGKNIPTALC